MRGRFVALAMATKRHGVLDNGQRSECGFGFRHCFLRRAFRRRGLRLVLVLLLVLVIVLVIEKPGALRGMAPMRQDEGR